MNTTAVKVKPKKSSSAQSKKTGLTTEVADTLESTADKGNFR